MNCVICGKEANEAFLRPGGYCGEEHKQEVLERYRSLLEELCREEAARMPETFCVGLFERFALKLAVHLLADMSAGVHELYLQRMPALLDPLEMAEELKAHILVQLPCTHVALQEARGLSRLFRNGNYTFLQLVPAALVVEAMDKAHLLPLLGAVPRQHREGSAPEQKEDV